MLNNLISKLRSSTGFKQSLISASGSFISSGLAAIATILITRKLGPELFGQFVAAFALVQILIRLNDAGLSTALSKFVAGTANSLQQAKFLGVITKLRLIFTGGILLIGAFLILPLANLLVLPPSLIGAAFLVFVSTVYFEHLQYTLQALHLFTTAAGTNVSQAIFKFSVALIFYFATDFADFKDLSLVLPIFVFYMIAPGFPVLLSKKLLPQSLTKLFKLKFFQLETQKVKKFISHAAIGIISAGIIENIDLLMVKAYLTDFEAGLLGGVGRIAMFLYILAYALGNVLNPRVAKYKTKTHLAKYWPKAVLVLAACLGGFLISLPLAKPVLTLTIGSQYLIGLPIMKILLAAGFLTISVMPFIAFFYSFSAPWYFSISGILQLVIVIGGNAIFLPIYGLQAAAWTRLAARIVLFVFTVVVAVREYRRVCLANKSQALDT